MIVVCCMATGDDERQMTIKSRAVYSRHSWVVRGTTVVVMAFTMFANA